MVGNIFYFFSSFTFFVFLLLLLLLLVRLVSLVIVAATAIANKHNTKSGAHTNTATVRVKAN